MLLISLNVILVFPAFILELIDSFNQLLHSDDIISIFIGNDIPSHKLKLGDNGVLAAVKNQFKFFHQLGQVHCIKICILFLKEFSSVYKTHQVQTILLSKLLLKIAFKSPIFSQLVKIQLKFLISIQVKLFWSYVSWIGLFELIQLVKNNAQSSFPKDIMFLEEISFSEVHWFSKNHTIW